MECQFDVKSIHWCLAHPVRGFVLGILSESNFLDINKNSVRFLDSHDPTCGHFVHKSLVYEKDNSKIFYCDPAEKIFFISTQITFVHTNFVCVKKINKKRYTQKTQ